MTRRQFTDQEDDYLRCNYLKKDNDLLSDALGRPQPSVNSRMITLDLRRERINPANPYKGVQRKGRFYINYSEWKTSLDTPCCALMSCLRCNNLLPIIDFYALSGSGRKDILGNNRVGYCKSCEIAKYKQLSISTKLFYNAKQRASERGIPFEITPKDIEVPAECPVLGIPLVPDEGGKGNESWSDNSPTLDRMVNDKGYVKGNICVISRKANILKKQASMRQYEAILIYIRNWKDGVPPIGSRAKYFRSFYDAIGSDHE